MLCLAVICFTAVGASSTPGTKPAPPTSSSALMPFEPIPEEAINRSTLSIMDPKYQRGRNKLEMTGETFANMVEPLIQMPQKHPKYCQGLGPIGFGLAGHWYNCGLIDFFLENVVSRRQLEQIFANVSKGHFYIQPKHRDGNYSVLVGAGCPKSPEGVDPSQNCITIWVELNKASLGRVL